MEEDIKEYEELKSLLYTDRLTQYGKRKLVEIIENLINRNKELEEELEQRIEQKVLDYRYVDKEMISKDILEKYLKEVKEKYQVYKKEVKNNDNLKPQFFKLSGEIDVLEKILNKPRKVITLD